MYSKEIYDNASMLKDISERQEIIREYRTSGKLDREKAIRKICELRLSDTDVMVATNAKLAEISIPFDRAQDADLVAELQMQAEILSAKIANNNIAL